MHPPFSTCLGVGLPVVAAVFYCHHLLYPACLPLPCVSWLNENSSGTIGLLIDFVSGNRQKNGIPPSLSLQLILKRENQSKNFPPLDTNCHSLSIFTLQSRSSQVQFQLPRGHWSPWQIVGPFRNFSVWVLVEPGEEELEEYRRRQSVADRIEDRHTERRPLYWFLIIRMQLRRDVGCYCRMVSSDFKHGIVFVDRFSDECYDSSSQKTSRRAGRWHFSLQMFNVWGKDDRLCVPAELLIFGTIFTTAFPPYRSSHRNIQEDVFSHFV